MATKKLPPWLMKGKMNEKMPASKGKKPAMPGKKASMKSAPYKKKGV